MGHTIPTHAWKGFVALAGVLGALALGCGTGAVDFVAGPVEPGAPPAVSRVHDGLVYRAEFSLLREDAIEIRLTIENPGRAAREVSYADDCVALLRAYRAPDGALSWDQRSGKSRCREIQRTITIPARGATVFETGVSSLIILGASGSGEAEIAIYARPVGTAEMELVLGVVPLSFP